MGEDAKAHVASQNCTYRVGSSGRARLGLGGDTLSPLLESVLLFVFVLFVLIVGTSFSGLFISRPVSIIRSAVPAQTDIQSFIRRQYDGMTGQYTLFCEQMVVSKTHQFHGRFDQAVLHIKDLPILDMVVEYKFVKNNIPRTPREEDVFQAGLYALALMEMGASCRHTLLVVVYCRQDVARTCQRRERSRYCIDCRHGHVFSRRFRTEQILKILDRLDEVWFLGRSPRPSPERSKCNQCPYGSGGGCPHSYRG